ncbi:Ig-like domain repeat protein [Budviciaceae bacterium BWR-B9]|uniref:Ig-like domain repeat protein n=1 Tax=Limnobaculum allomyrinae TaxID=2791986 RepID=A0ABS1IPM7_9GAMM|nr:MULTISPECIES: Ig-like domain-containing protein [Limnobaculum]MBK5143694.1 Ig-like domain repeat protein [Limnobaculum allomyrinae]MBV7692710.1 Ig-like domain repeat protein [Limnobaculum sp. M2-1]
MSKNISLLVNSGGASSQVISLDSNNPARIQIQDGHQYILKNQDNNHSPENVTLKRHGNDLYVILEGDTDPAIVIDNYYVSGNHQPLLGIAEDGQLYSYITSDALNEGYMLADEGVTSVTLGGSSLGDSSYLFESVEYSDGLMASWPWFLGTAVIGGIGYGIYNTNKDDDNSSSSSVSLQTPDTKPQPSSQAEPQAESQVEPLPTPAETINTVGEVAIPAVSGTSTTENKTTIYGVGEAGDTITIYDNNQVIGTTVVNANGQWQFISETALNGGVHNITLTQTSPSGSTSGSSEAFSFTVDIATSEQPIAPVQAVFNSMVDSETLLAINLETKTASTTPIFSGVGEPGAVITFIDSSNASLLSAVNKSGKQLLKADGGKIIGQVTVGEDGIWSFTPDKPLAEGQHRITMISTDKDGNQSLPSDPIIFEIDITAPDTPVINAVLDSSGDLNNPILLGSNTHEAKPIISGQGEAGSTIIVTDRGEFIGSVITDQSGNWTFTPEVALSEGAHSICVAAIDEAGNGSQISDVFVFNVDTLAPEQPIINNVTDDKTPSFVGEGEPNSTVTIFDNDVLIGQAAVSDEGRWVFTPDEPLSVGTHNITARVTDSAGNVSEPSTVFEFISETTSSPTEPVVPTIEFVSADFRGDLDSGTAVNNATPTLKGTAEQSSVVTIFDNGTILGSTVADSTGKWSFTPAAELPAGDHAFTVAGDAGIPSAEFMVTVDPELHIHPPVPTEPVVPTIEFVSADFRGDLDSGTAVNNATPTLKGTAEQSSVVTIFDNGTILGSTVADSTGKWSFTPAAELPAGDHAFTVAGDAGIPSAEFMVTVDPELHIHPPVPEEPVVPTIESAQDDVGAIQGILKHGAITDDSTPTLAGKAAMGSVVKVYDGEELLGSTVADNQTGQWSFTSTTSLAEGEHQFHVVSVSATGNVSAPSDSFVLTVDTIAPEKPSINISIMLHADVLDDEGNPYIPGVDEWFGGFYGKGEPGSTITIIDNGNVVGQTIADASGSWVFTPPPALGSGDHETYVTAMDKAGNISESSNTVTFKLIGNDSEPQIPATIESAQDDVGAIQGILKHGAITDDSTPTLAGKAAMGSVVKVYDGEELLGSTVADNQTGQWSFTSTTSLAEGEHQFHVVSVSATGNVSAPSDSFVLTVDTIAPEAASDIDIVQYPCGAPEFITGTAEAHGVVTVYDNGSVIGSTVADFDGFWEFNLEHAPESGAHTITTTVMDSAGNISQASQEYSFYISLKGIGITELSDSTGEITGNIFPGSVTDEVRPIITGYAEVGYVIKIYDGSTLLGSTVAYEDGEWSFTPIDDLAQGEHSITAVAIDANDTVGNPTPAITFTIDITPPDAPTIESAQDDVGVIQGSLNSGDSTGDFTPTLSGKAEAGSVVNVYGTAIPLEGTALLGSVVVDSEGKWSFTPAFELAEGEYKFTVTSMDSAGNISVPSEPFILNLEYPAPASISSIKLIDDVGDIRGSIAPNGITDDARPEMTGNARTGDIIKVYDGDTCLGSIPVRSNSEWSFTPPTDLSEGVHSITVTATNEFGKTSEPSTAFVFFIETTAPVVPTIESAQDDVGAIQGILKHGDITDDATPTLTGKATMGSVVKVYDGEELLGSTVADNQTGQWSFTSTTSLAEGEHQFHVVSVSATGNVSAPSDSFVLTVDTIAPEAASDIDIVQYPCGAPEFITGTAEAHGVVTVYDNGSVIGSTVADFDGYWEFNLEHAPESGAHTITTTVMDSAGNISQASQEYSFYISLKGIGITELSDSTGEITGNIFPGSVTDEVRPIITGYAEVGYVIKIYDGSTLLGSTVAYEDGEWSFTPIDDLAQGEHSITAVAIDANDTVGNPTPAITFTIDITPPDAPTIESVSADFRGELTGDVIINNTLPTLSGVAEHGSTVRIFDNDNLIAIVEADGTTGKWSFTPKEDLLFGEHIFIAEAIDAAGNYSSQSPEFIVIIDSEFCIIPPPAEPPVTLTIESVSADFRGDLNSGTVVNNATPTLKGTAEQGSVVTILNNGTILGSTVADSAGKWSFTPAAELPAGDHAFTVAGDAGIPSAEFIVTVDPELHIHPPVPEEPVIPTIESVQDNVGAIQGLLKHGAITDDSTPTLTGKAAMGSVVKVYNDSVLLGSVIADAETGEWSFTPSTALLDGTYHFAVTSTDAVGNASLPSTVFDLTIDIPAPAPDIRQQILGVDDQVGHITGNVKSGDWTDDSQPTIHGVGTAGDIIRVYTKDAIDSHEIGSARVSADGTWSLKPSTPLYYGSNELTAVAIDGSGNAYMPSESYVISCGDGSQMPPVIEMVLDDVGITTGVLKQGSVTDDNKPTLSGTAARDCIVKVYDDATLLGSTLTDANGEWFFTPTSTLTDGSHNFTATSTSNIGQVSKPTGIFNIIVDTTAPATATNIATSNDDPTLLTGSAEANGTITVYSNDLVVGTVKVGADGSWSFNLSTVLAAGYDTFTVTVTDRAGNESVPSSAFTFDIDTVSPTVPTIDYAFDNVGHLTGALKNGDVTDDNTPTLHGSAIANSVVSIYLGGETIGSVTADADGKWVFTTAPIDMSTHVFTVTATDANGKVSEPSQAFSLAVDNGHYVPTIIAYVIDSVGDITGQIRKDSVIDDPRPYIAGTADKHSIVEIYDGETLLGSTRALSDGEWSFTPSFDLGQGEHSITAIATDIIGYVYPPSNAFSFTIDTTPPAMPTIESVSADFRSDMSSGTVTNDITPTLNGVAGKGNFVTIFDGDVKLGSVQADSTTGKWSFTPSFDLTYGDHTFTVISVDKAGNQSTQSPEFVVVIDADICIMPPPVEPSEAPGIPTITSLVDNVGIITGTVLSTHVTDDARPTLSGTAIANGIVTIYNNNAKFASVTADGEGKWSFTPETELPDDVYSINIDVTNAEGQTSGKSSYFYFYVDTVAPDASAAPVITYNNLDESISLKEGDVTDDCTPALSGLTEGGNIVTIYDHGVVIGSTTASSGGPWWYPTYGSPLADGEHQFTITIMDKAGNISTVSPEVNITIDTSGILPSVMYLSDLVGTVRGHVTANGSTDDLRPWITGSGKIDSVVMVYDNGVLLGSSTVAAFSSRWYIKPDFDLAEGKHSITLVATDKMGNHSESISAFDFIVDTVAPAIPTIESAIDNMGSIQGLLSSGDITDDSTPTLTGKAEVGSIVRVYDGSVLLGSTTVDSLSGEWSFTPAAYLAKGEHQFHVTAIDTAGNNSQSSESFSLILDYSQPDSANLAITNVHSDGPVEVMNNGPMYTGDIENGGAISYGKPLISGTGTAGDVIVLYSNGYYSHLELGSTTVDANGKWSLQLTNSLQLDDNELFVVGMDDQGNVTGTSAPYAVIYYGIWFDAITPDFVLESDSLVPANVEDENAETVDDATTGTLLHSANLVFFGSEGTDTLILKGQSDQLKSGLMQDKLTSVEIIDLGDGNNTMTVSLHDVLRLGTEELAINSGNKAMVVDGDESSTLQLEEMDTQWSTSQSEHQYAGNTYDVWTTASSNVEVLVENNVHVMM